MNCLQAGEHFSDHFEDTLDYQTLQDLFTHFSGCEACQQEYGRFQESVKAVQQLPQIEPSPYFMPTLLHRIAEEQHEIGSVKEIAVTGWKRLLAGLRRPLWALSGILALIFAVTGTYLYQGGFLFDPDTGSTAITSNTSQKVQVATSPVRPRRVVGNGSQLLPDGVIPTSPRPMQQHYVLKQVSYINASTSGGL